jgi:hypothetical protein
VYRSVLSCDWKTSDFRPEKPTRIVIHAVLRRNAQKTAQFCADLLGGVVDPKDFYLGRYFADGSASGKHSRFCIADG